MRYALLLLVLLASCAAPQQFAAPQTTLNVDVTPAGSQVLLDRIDVGVTPLTLAGDELVGRREVLVRREGYRDFGAIVTLSSGQSHTVSGVMEEVSTEPIPLGSISVTSEPSGASVYVNGQFAGTTPLLLSDMAETYHDIRVALPGYKEYSQRVLAYRQTQRDVHAALEER